MKTERSLENIQPNQAEIKEFKELEREAADFIGKEFHGALSSKTLEKMPGLPSEFKSNEEVAKAYEGVPDMEGSKPHTRLQREVDRFVTQEMSNRAQNEANASLKEIETNIKTGKANRLEMTKEATSRELKKDLDAQKKDE